MAATAPTPKVMIAVPGIEYDVLDQTKAEFRLIRIVGESTDSAIHCELRTFSLYAGAPEWKAVSYRWGNGDHKYIIRINGRIFPMRENLFEFFIQTKIQQNRRWFFVDAICINQHDVQERNQQVRLMRDIYKNAHEVIIWIPTDDPDVRHASPKNLGWIKRKKRFHLSESKAKQEVEQIRQKMKWMVLSDEYWSRVWIAQEVVLARKLMIKIGNLNLKESYFGLAGQITGEEAVFHAHIHAVDAPLDNIAPELREKALLMPNYSRAVDILTMRANAGEDIRAGKLLSFDEAMGLFCSMHCELVQDKVLGLLGIMDTCITPDYDMSQITLYIHVIAESIASSRFRNLSFVEHSVVQFVKLTYGIQLGFDTKLAHPLVFLIWHVVGNIFFSEVLVGLLIDISVRDSFWDHHTISSEGNIVMGPSDQVPELMLRMVQDHAVRLETRIHEMKRQMMENSLLTSPWKTNDGRQDSRPCAQWIGVIHAQCEAIFRYYHERHEANTIGENKQGQADLSASAYFASKPCGELHAYFRRLMASL